MRSRVLGKSGLIAGVALVLAAVGCSSAQSPDATIGIAVGVAKSALTEPGAPIAITDADGTAFELVGAQATLRSIELYLPLGVSCASIEAQLGGGAACSTHDAGDDHPEEDAGDDDKIVIPGPITVDLLTRASTPDLSLVTLPNVAFRRIDLRVDGEGGAPSVVVHAKQPGSDVTIALALDLNEDVRVEAPGGLDIAPGASLLVALDAAKWLEGVPLTACAAEAGAPDEDGYVHVDDDMGGACSDVADAAEDNLEGSGGLGSDDDDGLDDVGDDHGADDVGDDNGTDDVGDDNGTDDVGDDNGTDDVGDDNGVDDPAEDEAGDDNGVDENDQPDDGDA